MSLVAVTAANVAPTWTKELAHETTDSGAGSKFADLLSTFENETTKVEASSKGASADATERRLRRGESRSRQGVAARYARGHARRAVRMTSSAAAPTRLRPARPLCPRRRAAA